MWLILTWLSAIIFVVEFITQGTSNTARLAVAMAALALYKIEKMEKK